MQRFSIDTIYHAAAYKHVPLMEQNVMQCISNNVFGTLNLVEKAVAKKITNFILVSTDKAVNQQTSWELQNDLQNLFANLFSGLTSNTKFSIVRFGNVLESSRYNLCRYLEARFKNGGPLTVTLQDITPLFL